MKGNFKLRVPDEPKAEFVSHGNLGVELRPGETWRRPIERFADWLVSNYDLTRSIVAMCRTNRRVETETAPEPTAEDLAAGYPDDLPGRDALITAEVPVSTAKTLSVEQLAEYKGIGPKSAAAIVEYFAAGGNE
jgi:CRP-like cAMP-binding protein